MGSEAEDFFGKLLAFGLLIAGIGWLLQWVCNKIVEHANQIILVVVGLLVLLTIIGVFKAGARRKEAIALWEQNQLVPLLSSLNALNKLNRAESAVASIPRELEAAEGRVPALERRMKEIDTRARGVNLT